MGDYLSYSTLATPAATDWILSCGQANAAVYRSSRAQFLPTVTDGTTTLTGVGKIVLDGGSVTGSSGGTAGLGSATLTVEAGAGLPEGPIYGNVGTFSIPNLSTWTVLSTGGGTGPTAAFTQSANGQPIILNSGAGTVGGLALLEQSVSGTFTATILVETQNLGSGGGGVFVTDGTYVAAMFPFPPSNDLYVQKYTGAATFNGDATAKGTFNFTGPKWYRVQYSGGNLTWSWSSNGIDFTQFDTNTLSFYGLGTPTGAGFCAYVGSENAPFAYYIWHFTVTSP